MLMGKIPDFTLHKSVKTSRDKVERAKKFGIKKTGQVTKNPIGKNALSISPTTI